MLFRSSVQSIHGVNLTAEDEDIQLFLEANKAEVIDIKKLGEDVQRFKSVKTLVEYTPGSIKLEKLKGMGNTVSILGFIVFALAAIGLLVCCYNCRCCCCTPFRGLYKTFRMMNVCGKCIVRKNEKIANDTATTDFSRYMEYRRKIDKDAKANRRYRMKQIGRAHV